MSRSFLLLENISSGNLLFEIGCGAAHATLTSGAVSSVTVDNAGAGYSKPPLVRFWGGGNAFGNSSYVGLSQPNGAAPNSVGTAGRVALAHCVMTGSAPNLSISSITVDDGGAGYVIAPYVEIINSDLDPNGYAVPSATSGILLSAAGSLTLNGTCCPTDPVAVYGATTGQAFVCRWMD